MPRTAEDGSTPSWDRLWEIAAAQMGYFTLAQADEAGFSRPLLQYHLNSGRLERSGRGVLRLARFPPGDHEDLMPLWLWAEGEGVFSHETALSLHELSDALPATRHMIVPSSWRRAASGFQRDWCSTTAISTQPRWSGRGPSRSPSPFGPSSTAPSMQWNPTS